MRSIKRTVLNKFLFISLPAITMLATGLIACSQSSPSANNGLGISDGKDTPNQVTLSSQTPRRTFHSCKHTSANCYTETFQQPPGTAQPMDILFVVQTANSILPERETINTGIANFIASLPAGADYNVAVMLAHGSTSILSGKLFQVDSEPLVLKSLEIPVSQIQAGLNLKLSSDAQDPDSDGGEEGIFSLFNGITNPTLLAASQAAGFFRPTAGLTVVFIGDERDVCAVVPADATPETDPVEIAARIRDCEGLTAAGLTNQLHLLKGTQPLGVDGIIYVDSPVPVDGENEIGYGYTDMITLSSGVAIDIANDNIGTSLTAAIPLTAPGPSQNSFTLSHSGADSATIKVQVNGIDVPYTLLGDVITITQEIPPGATVVISYCTKSTETSHCNKRHHDRFHSHHRDGNKNDNDDDDDRDHDDQSREIHNQDNSKKNVSGGSCKKTQDTDRSKSKKH